MTAATYAEHQFTAEHVRLIGIGLRRVFNMARQTSADHPDQLGQSALRLAGLTAKRLHNLLTSRSKIAGLDGITWHPASSGDLAGILQVQDGTFGATVLPAILDAAIQALVVTQDEALRAMACSSIASWADDHTSAEVKAQALDEEVARLRDERFVAIRLLSEVLECC